MAERTKTTRRTAPAAPPVQPTRAKARIGKKAVVGYYDPTVNDRLRILSERHDKTMQVLLGEALNMLFAKNGLPEFEVS